MMRSIVGVAGFRSAGLASRRCAHRSSQHDPPPRPAADALDAGDRVCPSRPAAVNHMQNGRTEAIHVAHTLVPCPQDTIIVNIINNRRIVTGRASARTTRTVRLIEHSPYFPGASGWRGGAEWASRWLWWRRSPAPEARPLPLPRRTLGPMDIGDDARWHQASLPGAGIVLNTAFRLGSFSCEHNALADMDSEAGRNPLRIRGQQEGVMRVAGSWPPPASSIAPTRSDGLSTRYCATQIPRSRSGRQGGT